MSIGFTHKISKLKMDPLPHQQRVSRTLEDTPGQIAMHGLGTGKCVLGSTVVALQHYVGPIEGIAPEAPLVGDEDFTPIPHRAARPSGTLGICGLYRQRVDEELIRVTTESGDVITTTGAHRYLRRKLDANVWVRAAGLKPGVKLAALRRIGPNGGEPLDPVLCDWAQDNIQSGEMWGPRFTFPQDIFHLSAMGVAEIADIIIRGAGSDYHAVSFMSRTAAEQFRAMLLRVGIFAKMLVADTRILRRPTFVVVPERAPTVSGAYEAIADPNAQHYRFDKIVKVERVPFKGIVYDLTIDTTDDNERWYAAGSGLLLHNTFTAINAADKQNASLVAITPASLRNNMRKEIAASGFDKPFRVMSYEEAAKKRNDPEFQDFASKSIVAYDEAHRASRPGSVRSTLPSSIPAKKKLFLTGTPIRNAPHEVAPLVNALQPGSLPDTEKDFRKHFIHTREIPVGFWGRLKGVKPGKVDEPKNLQYFEHAVKGKVDYHENVDRSVVPSHSESIVEVPMSDRQQATYNFVMGRYPRLAYKIRHGLPLNKQETKSFRSFMIGPRQVSNHPATFNRSATDQDAAKVMKIADEVEERFKKDKNYRGVSYSAFLDSGVKPISRELTRRGIPHHIFTGEQNDEERKKIIEDYNSGRVPHLLISGAGAEGLDLKGTKLMQITEPHWNEEQINQVRGRAIRYMSHSHLPEDERHVEVQRFHTTPQRSFMDKLLGRPRSSKHGVDEYLYNLATQKQRISRPFLDIMKGVPASEAEARYKQGAVSDAILGVPVALPSGEALITGVERARKTARAFARSVYAIG